MKSRDLQEAVACRGRTAVPNRPAHAIALGLVLLLMLVGLSGILEVASEVYEEQSAGSAAAGELFGSAAVGQTIVASYPGLCSIEVRLGTYARQNTGSAMFYLRPSQESSQVLVAASIDLEQLEDNEYHTIEFAPIEDSAGRSFYFSFQAPDSSPGNAISVVGTVLDAYPTGEAVVEGLAGQSVQDLAFRLVYDPPLWGRVACFLDRLVAGKPSIWGDTWLYLGLAVLYVVLLYALIVRVLSLAAPTEEPN